MKYTFQFKRNYHSRSRCGQKEQEAQGILGTYSFYIPHISQRLNRISCSLSSEQWSWLSTSWIPGQRSHSTLLHMRAKVRVVKLSKLSVGVEEKQKLFYNSDLACSCWNIRVYVVVLTSIFCFLTEGDLSWAHDGMVVSLHVPLLAQVVPWRRGLESEHKANTRWT